MKTILISLLLFASILYMGCVKDVSGNTPAPTTSADVTTSMTPEMQIKRGAYLVNSMGCDDCHSPKLMGPNGPEIDPKLRLSGHQANRPLAVVKDKSVLANYVLFEAMDFTAAVGPWGTSFAANLTPDDTGIGNWTEAQFLKAIKEGKLKGLDGSRQLLPPMPWFVYKNLTDEDLKAIFAYLKTLTPVSNVVPAPVPPMG